MARILLIEDDIHVQGMLRALLERNSHSVDTVFDGLDGIEKAKEESYDIVITDMHLADTDGLTIIGNIQSINDAIPIIAISGGDPMQSKDMSKLHQARKTNIARVFQKPFEHSQLLEAIEEVLTKKSKKGFLGFGSG